MKDEFSPLGYDPFDGDDYASVVFLDKMVKAKKEHKCCHCHEKIIVDEAHRKLVEKFDGEMVVTRWCAKCCKAMVEDLKAEAEGIMGDAFENRMFIKE